MFIGKRVLVRVDVNVPLNKDGTIADDTRIVATLPTIHLLKHMKCKIILVSHYGRPKPCYDNSGKSIAIVNDAYRIPSDVITTYSKHDINVEKLHSSIGDDITGKINKMNNGDVILLENVRFYEGETINDPVFSKHLAHNADVFVMDAFGTSHRKHSSTFGVSEHIPICVAGLLMEKELCYMDKIMNSNARPTAAIIGGSKVSSKLGVIKSLLKKCDKLFIGGGMANTFLKSRGISTGSSLVEDNMLDIVKQIENDAIEENVEIFIPIDYVVSETFDNNSNSIRVLSSNDSCDGWMIMDIGPKTLDLFREHIADCKLIVWNGPMGVFENEHFANGTKQMAFGLTQHVQIGNTVIVGGGDSVSAVNQFGIAAHFSHVSTGGGAMLEYLEGKNHYTLNK